MNFLKKDSRIFIAGHSGLIGSAFVRYFRAHNFPNLILRNRSGLDLTDTQQVDSFFKTEHPDLVILAAGKVGGIEENKTYPADFITANFAIQMNVIRSAHLSNVKKLIFFGSSCMYPKECRQPMKEDLLLTGKPEPTSIAYAVAKLAGVQMCLSYNRQFGTDLFLPVIPNSVYGANDNFNPNSGHVLSALIRRFHEAKEKGISQITLWGDGSPRREFLYSEDLVSACLLLLQTPLEESELPINIGTGEDISIQELALLIANIVGYKGEIEWDSSKPNGALQKLLDSSRLNALGWRPKIRLEEGIRTTYRWYLEQLVKA